MTTSALRGRFDDEFPLQSEFLSLASQATALTRTLPG
jgi:hypothetical protein